MKKRNCSLVWGFSTIVFLVAVSCQPEGSEESGENPESEPCGSEWGIILESANQCWTTPENSVDKYREDAVQYCEDLELGGNDDWVLPSRSDFELILGNCVEENSEMGNLERIQCDVCSISTECTKMFGNDDWWYWTSTPCDEFNDDYWDVDLSWGLFERTANGNPRGVLCVRTI